MIYEIAQRFNDDIVAEAARRYGMEPEQVKKLEAFESYVYSYERNGQSYILKITHTIRRSVNYLLGELEWVNYLADGGVTVSRCVLSDAGNLVEVIEEADGHAFLVMAYEKAQGAPLKAKDWSPQMYQTWGRMMGRMHRLTQSYELRDPALQRQQWYEEDQLNAQKYLNVEEDAEVMEAAEALFKRIHSLPKSRDSYGLCHTDLHQGNLHVNEDGKLTAFDFDDCQYAWFAYDIAVTLYYTYFYNDGAAQYESRAALTQEFMENFMSGYREENFLDMAWMEQIHDFMRLRHLMQYIILNQAKATLPQKLLDMIPRHRGEVVEGVALVDFDFSGLKV